MITEMKKRPSKGSRAIGGETVLVIMKISIFWDITPRIANYFTLISLLAYYSTLKREVINSSETFDDFQRITRRYISEDNNLSREPG
jgi:hypothetical protein